MKVIPVGISVNKTHQNNLKVFDVLSSFPNLTVVAADNENAAESKDVVKNNEINTINPTTASLGK